MTDFLRKTRSFGPFLTLIVFGVFAGMYGIGYFNDAPTLEEEIELKRKSVSDIKALIKGAENRLNAINKLVVEEQVLRDGIKKKDLSREGSRKDASADIKRISDNIESLCKEIETYHRAYSEQRCKEAVGKNFPVLKIKNLGIRENVTVEKLDSLKKRVWFSYDWKIGQQIRRMKANTHVNAFPDDFVERLQLELRGDLKRLLEAEKAPVKRAPPPPRVLPPPGRNAVPNGLDVNKLRKERREASDKIAGLDKGIASAQKVIAKNGGRILDLEREIRDRRNNKNQTDLILEKTHRMEDEACMLDAKNEELCDQIDLAERMRRDLEEEIRRLDAQINRAMR